MITNPMSVGRDNTNYSQGAVLSEFGMNSRTSPIVDKQPAPLGEAGDILDQARVGQG